MIIINCPTCNSIPKIESSSSKTWTKYRVMCWHSPVTFRATDLLGTEEKAIKEWNAGNSYAMRTTGRNDNWNLKNGD